MFFKGIPRTDSFTPYVRLLCHLSLITYTLSCLYLVIHPLQGTFSPPPSNVLIKSSVSERWEMAASGSVAWTASPDKSIASCTPLVSRAKLVTAQTQTQPHPKPPSPQGPALKPTYSQALKAPTLPRDPGKPARDPLPPSGARDPARDLTPDLSRDVSRVVSNTTRSPDPRVTRTHTRRVTRPSHEWKTVGVKPREGIPQGIPHSLPKANPIGRY